MHIAIVDMNIFIHGSYLRGDTISDNSRSLWQLFEGDYYSKCGIYSRKYGITHNHYQSLLETDIKI